MNTYDVKYFLARVKAPHSVIRSAYGAHRLLWQAFPDAEARAQPFTFRLEGEDADGVVLLMQSASKPDFTMVFGVQAQTKEVSFEVREGARYAFRARTCPTRTLPRSEADARPEALGRWARAKRVPLRDRQEVQRWMERQAKAHGFEVLDVVFTMGKEEVSLRRKADETRRDFAVTDVVFDGSLRVTDPQAFARTLLCGFGRGRSYGYGMLSISKLF